MKILCLFLCLIPVFSQASDLRDIARRNFRESFFRNENSYLPLPNDRAEDLVDEMKVWNLEEMEQYRKAELPVLPWSDSYWPLYSGVIAYRYADIHYNAALDWKLNERYLMENLGRGPVDKMSPAEKYDILIGDKNFTLTKLMINEGRPYYEKDGKVEGWMGICHGWAPASFMMGRPAHSIGVIAADGKTKIRFYPSDIKALASLLWANSKYETRFIGGRCNLNDPPRDENGRNREDECIDTNAGTWHLAIVNQLGINRRSMILDTSYDYQVWNQPIFGYFYSYINPKTGLKAQTLQEAIVQRSDFEDPLKRYRATGSTKIVRIAMNVNYVLERSPEPAEVDFPSMDARGNVLYIYDLELDDSGKILGGEWISPNHPDFLWVPAKGAQALSMGDFELMRANDSSIWVAGEPVPSSWRKPAMLSSKRSQPLYRIVKGLIEFSNL